MAEGISTPVWHNDPGTRDRGICCESKSSSCWLPLPAVQQQAGDVCEFSKGSTLFRPIIMPANFA